MKTLSYRILACILLATFVFSLAACAPAATSAPTVPPAATNLPTAPPASTLKGDLSVLIMKDNPGQDVPTQEQIMAWGKANNVNVTVEVSTLTNLSVKDATIIQSGTGADVFIIQGYGPQLYADSLLDLTDVAEEIGNADGGFYDIAKQLGMVNGTWKAIPVYIYMHQIIYRIDMLKAIGEPVPDTWDDLLRVSKELEAKFGPSGTDAIGVPYGRSSDGSQFTQAVLWAYGSKMFTDDGKKVTFDSPETVTGLKYVVDLYNQNVTPKGVMAWDDSANNQAFLANQIAMTANGSSIKVQAKTVSQELYDNTGIAVMPKGPAGRFSFPNPFSFAVRKNTQNPEAAKSLLRYLFDKKNYGDLITVTGGAIGSSLKGFESLPVWNTPDTKAMLDAIPTARLTGWPAAPSKVSADVDSARIVIDMVGRVINDKLTPEQAVTEAAGKIQQILDADSK